MRLPKEMWNVKKEEINYRIEIYIIYLYDYKHTCYVCVCVHIHTYICVSKYPRSAKVCNTSEIYAYAIKIHFLLTLIYND